MAPKRAAKKAAAPPPPPPPPAESSDDETRSGSRSRSDESEDEEVIADSPVPAATPALKNAPAPSQKGAESESSEEESDEEEEEEPARAPPKNHPPPPQNKEDSGSDDEEEEEEEEEKEEPAPKKQPPPALKNQPPPAPKKSEESDDEEEEEEEEEEPAPKKQPPPALKNQPPPAPKKSEESDDEEEEEEEEEEPAPKKQPPPALKNQPPPALKNQPPPTPKKSETSDASEEEDEEEEEAPPPKLTPKKDLKPLAAAAETKKQGGIQRIWSTNDEVRILEALTAHQKQHGTLPQPDALIDVLAGKLDNPAYGSKELQSKVRNLRHRYLTLSRRGEVPSKEHDRQLLHLSKLVWTGDKITSPVATTGTANNGQERQKGFEEMCELYPYLAEEVKELEATHPGLCKREFGKMDGDKARALDEKVKRQRVAQIRLEMRRSDLAKEVTKALVDLMDG